MKNIKHEYLWILIRAEEMNENCEKNQGGGALSKLLVFQLLSAL